MSRRDSTYVNRAVRGMLPVACCMTGAALLGHFFDSVTYDWSAARLAPALAWASSGQLYWGPDAGPILANMYGPVVAAVYYPAALFHSADAAMWMGVAIAILFTVVPVVWLFSSLSRQESYVRQLSLLAAAGMLLFVCSFPSLTYSCTQVHADNVILGLLTLASVLLISRRSGPLAVGVAAGLLVLAIWSKQTSIPAWFAGAAWVLVHRPTKDKIGFLAGSVVTGAITTGLILWWFDIDLLVFNLLTVPLSHPWIDPNPVKALGKVGLTFLQEAYWPVTLAVFLPLLALSKLPIATLKDWRSWSTRPSLYFLLLSLSLLPGAFLTSVKFGGGHNGVSFPLFFVLVALLLEILNWAHSAQIQFARAAQLFLFVLIAGQCVHVLPNAVAALERWGEGRPNPHQVGFEFAKAHPGQVWFPWDPVPSILAEGRVDHFAWGLIDREVAGFQPSDEHFRAHLPPDLKWVAFWEPQNLNAMQYLPEFKRQVTLEGLPGWIVFERGEPLPGPDSSSPGS